MDAARFPARRAMRRLAAMHRALLLALPFPLLLAALLGGCGFELRGADVLPPQMGRLHLVAPVALREEIEILLDGSETELVEERAQAELVLTLANPRFDRRVLSVDPNTGKEREFELSYTVDLSARRADGSEVIAPASQSLLRDYVFDRETLIGSSFQESVLREEMVRDMAQQVLYRLRAAARP